MYTSIFTKGFFIVHYCAVNFLHYLKCTSTKANVKYVNNALKTMKKCYIIQTIPYVRLNCKLSKHL